MWVVFVNFERFRHNATQRFKVGFIGDDKVFTVGESVWCGWKGWACEREANAVINYIFFFHSVVNSLVKYTEIIDDGWLNKYMHGANFNGI